MSIDGVYEGYGLSTTGEMTEEDQTEKGGGYSRKGEQTSDIEKKEAFKDCPTRGGEGKRG